jgi:hypothetical protein
MIKAFRKADGAIAHGIIAENEGGGWMASVIVKQAGEQRVRGPAVWATLELAKAFIVRQASFDGFAEDDVGIDSIEPLRKRQADPIPNAEDCALVD